MTDLQAERIHPASPQRHQQAREQGRVAKSRDLASAIVLLGGILVLWFLGRDVVQLLGLLAQTSLGREAWQTADIGFAVEQWNWTVGNLARVLLPILGSLLLLAVLGHVSQVGVLLLPGKLAPDPNRINPLAVLRRVAAPGNLLDGGLATLKVAVILAVAGSFVWSRRESLLASGAVEPAQSAALMVEIVLGVCLRVAVAMVVMGVVDYGYQRWKLDRELRMTTQELREEMRSQSGDPQLVHRRRQLHRRMMQDQLVRPVARADFVLTAGDQLAVAISYREHETDAPLVLAKATGATAQWIHAEAQERRIPIEDNRDLARDLYRRVPIGQPIPPDHYPAVARLLSKNPLSEKAAA
jgi:flagellar biosynthetic protein FlhB